jgi:hypothetical protein
MTLIGTFSILYRYHFLRIKFRINESLILNFRVLVDLSPIEQIWSYFKKQLKAKKFQTADKLFAALAQERQ